MKRNRSHQARLCIRTGFCQWPRWHLCLQEDVEWLHLLDAKLHLRRKACEHYRSKVCWLGEWVQQAQNCYKWSFLFWRWFRSLAHIVLFFYELWHFLRFFLLPDLLVFSIWQGCICRSLRICKGCICRRHCSFAVVSTPSWISSKLSFDYVSVHKYCMNYT